jgi:hypothetical protein
VWVQRDHHRLGVDLLSDLPHVVVGDRAHGAQRLGDDEVGRELVQHLGVEFVDRFAGQRALLDRGVDLGRAEPGGQHVARHLRQILRPRRIIALVRDPDDAVAEPEREQQLGGGWDEADDAHAQVCGQSARGSFNGSE